MTKVKLAAVAFGAGLLAVSAAQANPISTYYSFDGTNYMALSAANNTDGTNGVSGVMLTNGSNTFTVSFAAQGSNSTNTGLRAPNFDTSTTTVQSTGAGTLYLAGIETGLTNTNVGSFTLGFTNNNTQSSTLTESFYVGANLNLASTPLYTTTLGPVDAKSVTINAPSLTSPYQVASLYKMTFTGSQQQINATINETGNLVPEPISISLLGAGLAGVGLLRMRRKQG